MNNWARTVQHCRFRGIIYFELKHPWKKFERLASLNRYSTIIPKLSWPVIVPCHNVTKSLGKVKQFGASSSRTQISSSLKRPQWVRYPSTTACWNNVVANPCVYRASHCGKHGFKKVWQLLNSHHPLCLIKAGRGWKCSLNWAQTSFCSH